MKMLGNLCDILFFCKKFLLLIGYNDKFVFYLRYLKFPKQSKVFQINMPQHKSAEKRVRQSAKRRLANRDKRSKMRTLTRKVFETSEKERAEKLLGDAVSYIDRLACKGLVHKNNAANKKSKLVRHVNNL